MKRVDKVRRVTCPECKAEPGVYCTDNGRIRDANHQARIKAHSVAYPPIARILPPAGSLAWHDGICPRCDGVIQRHVHQVVERKGSWIHVTCASGQDEA